MQKADKYHKSRLSWNKSLIYDKIIVMSEKKVGSKNPLSYLMGLIQIYTILIVFMILGMIKSSDIWYDEVFSVRFAQLRMDSLIEMASRDVHPLLYYIYLVKRLLNLK